MLALDIIVQVNKMNLSLNSITVCHMEHWSV